LAGEIQTPPFTREARIGAGVLLRRLQRGDSIGMPALRPMPAVGWKCAELRVRDETQNWRIMLRVDNDAIVILGVFSKKTRTTPKKVIEECKRRLRRYDEATRGARG
jgi:phage-related protein